jgi:uncharacterized membrane protein YoaK (UPF0700 family)
METKLSTNRWQDWCNLVLGAWLFISPWVMQYPADKPAAMWNAHILGVVVFVLAIIALYGQRLWEEGWNTVLGLWLIISPWVLRFSPHRDVTTNAVIVGILVAVIAGLATMQVKRFEEELRHSHQP